MGCGCSGSDKVTSYVTGASISMDGAQRKAFFNP